MCRCLLLLLLIVEEILKDGFLEFLIQVPQKGAHQAHITGQSQIGQLPVRQQLLRWLLTLPIPILFPFSALVVLLGLAWRRSCRFLLLLERIFEVFRGGKTLDKLKTADKVITCFDSITDNMLLLLEKD